MQEIQVKENLAGQRLNKLLEKYLKEAPKSFIYKMLRKKNITLNDKKATGAELLKEGDRVKLWFSEETLAKFTASNQNKFSVDLVAQAEEYPNLDILYENQDILIVNKPTGILSQKSKEDDFSINEQILAYSLESGKITADSLQFFKPSICNRLDRNTTGLVTAGLSLAGSRDLNQAFQERSLGKYYLCICAGNISKKDNIQGYLIKDEVHNQVQIKQEKQAGAVYIETEYAPLVCSQDYTLLQVHLITGKSHQIRAHLSSQGFPILGDSKYGDQKKNKSFEQDYGIKLESQLLHAHRLLFPLESSGALAPLCGKEVIAPPPPLFQVICQVLGLGELY